MHTHIIISTLNETHLFKLAGSLDSIEHVDAEAGGRSHVGPTLAVSNIPKLIPGNASKPNATYENSTFVIKVTTTEVICFDFDHVLGDPNIIETWSPKEQSTVWHSKYIVAASVNPSQILLALNGGILVSLRFNGAGGFELLQCVSTSHVWFRAE